MGCHPVAVFKPGGSLAPHRKQKASTLYFCPNLIKLRFGQKDLVQKPHTKISVKVPPLVVESFYVDGRTHRHDEANRCLSPLLCERAQTGSLIKNI